MNQVRALFLLASVSVLAGCGGGSDSPAPPPPLSVIVPSPAPAPVAGPASFSRDNIQAVASLGALTTLFTGSGDGPIFMTAASTNFLLTDSTFTSGSSTDTFSCVINGQGAGSLAVTTTKSATRIGYAVGDSVRLVYSNCRPGTSTVIRNGTINLTAQSAISNLAATSNSLSYQAVATNFTAEITAADRSTYNGMMNVTSQTTSASAANSGFSIPTGQSYRVLYRGLTYTYLGGTTYRATAATAPANFTRKLDGDVNLNLSSTPGTTIGLTIQTPTALASISSTFVAIAGTVATRDVLQNLATSVTVNGTAATVSGDTDRNGSLDLVFVTTWAALTQ